MNIWFTSDTHFGHKNIIKYCNRPFVDVEEMNEVLIANWNSVVKPEDIIFHLGDFTFLNPNVSQKIFDRLIGRKIIVLGNHDSRKNIRKYGFEIVVESTDLVDIGYPIYLEHCPSEDHKFQYQLCGHVHETWSERKGKVHQLNVGVDVRNFQPIHLDDILQKLGMT